jgi:glutamine amidotransferase
LKSTKQIALIDYGMGNLGSVKNALDFLGADVRVVDSGSDIAGASAYILPGVGAFGKAMQHLERGNLVGALNEEILGNKKPILGICLGMQLFAEGSTELGNHRGLGWIPGQVNLIDNQSGKMIVPHVGWNTLNFKPSEGLFKRIDGKTHFYFDHSYHFDTLPENRLAVVDYGTPITAAVRKGNIFGVQFHPEKSATAGLKLLRNFLNLVSEPGESHA